MRNQIGRREFVRTSMAGGGADQSNRPSTTGRLSVYFCQVREATLHRRVIHRKLPGHPTDDEFASQNRGAPGCE